MQVLVTGGRGWDDRHMIREVLEKFPDGTTLIHGDATGADTMASQEATRLGWTVWPYPADWARYGKAAGPLRNKQMLDEGKPDLVLAFHDNLKVSKGTLDMIDQARRAKVPVLLFSHGSNQMTLV